MSQEAEAQISQSGGEGLEKRKMLSPESQRLFVMCRAEDPSWVPGCSHLELTCLSWHHKNHEIIFHNRLDGIGNIDRLCPEQVCALIAGEYQHADQSTL